jgi:hypothetical protein
MRHLIEETPELIPFYLGSLPDQVSDVAAVTRVGVTPSDSCHFPAITVTGLMRLSFWLAIFP